MRTRIIRLYDPTYSADVYNVLLWQAPAPECLPCWCKVATFELGEYGRAARCAEFYSSETEEPVIEAEYDNGVQVPCEP